MAKSKRIAIKDLRGDCVDESTVHVDWREILGDNLDGFTPYEWVECSCGHEFCAVGFSPCCPECGDDCDGAEGPQMNYYYPVKIDDCEAAAEKIRDLPLCVVQLEDGTTALALTGGGMDLSWPIARAHVALGELPPAWIRLPRMAGWEEYSDAHYLIRCCLESQRVMIRRATWGLADLQAMQRDRTKAIRERKATKKSA